jgi:hypothetical protein
LLSGALLGAQGRQTFARGFALSSTVRLEGIA